MPISEHTIVIIGAGVLGLSTATLLQTKDPKCKVVIMATELPTTPSPTADYASVWAGAHYRPIPGTIRQLEDEAELAIRTAEIMKRIARETPEAGVGTMPGIEYLDDPPEANLTLKTGDVYAGPDDHFRVLEKAELLPGAQWGCEYDSYSVNVPVYSKWLLDKFITGGGQVIQHKLKAAEEAFDCAQEAGLGTVSTVVNCSGRNFDRDPRMNIIRGQTVLVRQQYDKTVTRQNRDGTWAFLIPRPRGGGTIVGGSKEIGDWEAGVRPETRQKLLQQSVDSFPDFVDSVEQFDVLKDNVGRRPWRDGGLRIEVEALDSNRRIVHGYGAGGRGYELSWGAAERIVELTAQRVLQAQR